jgi:glycerol-3-phosphate responsive antiterminator
VPLARAVKKATRIPVIAVGLITDFEQAEAIVGTGDAAWSRLRGRFSTIRAGRGMRPRISVRM